MGHELYGGSSTMDAVFLKPKRPASAGIDMKKDREHGFKHNGKPVNHSFLSA